MCIPCTPGREAINASVDAATRSNSEAIAVAGAAASDGSTAAVAAPHDTICATVTVERTEVMELSCSEPSESGELPLVELTMEQRAEVRQGKRGREQNEAAGGINPAWDVLRVKEELTKRGLCTSGLMKRDLVPRLAAAMVDEGGGEREEARPRICMRER